MARMSHEDAKQFESPTLDILSLQDDGDTERVQFLISSIEEVMSFTYHGVTMLSQNKREYERKISCLKTSMADPEGTCPMCDHGAKVKTTRFIPMYSHTQQKVILWERSSRFVDQILGGFINRMITTNGVKDFKNLVVDIVRNGRKGDQRTTYAFYPLENETPVDVTNMEIPDPEGSLIATWTPAEMQRYATEGVIPTENGDVNQGVQRRDRTATAAPPTGQYAPNPNYGGTAQPQPGSHTPSTGGPVNYSQPAGTGAPNVRGSFTPPTDNPADYF